MPRKKLWTEWTTGRDAPRCGVCNRKINGFSLVVQLARSPRPHVCLRCLLDAIARYQRETATCDL